MVRIVSSTHSCVIRFPQMLWFLLVSGVMAEADSGKTDQTSVDADAIRLGTERLQAHFQSLPVAKGKVALSWRHVVMSLRWWSTSVLSCLRAEH